MDDQCNGGNGANCEGANSGGNSVGVIIHWWQWCELWRSELGRSKKWRELSKSDHTQETMADQWRQLSVQWQQSKQWVAVIDLERSQSDGQRDVAMDNA